MQEDIQRRTVAVAVKATKLTSRVLAKILFTIGNKIKMEQQKGQTPSGRQSVKKLMNHNVSTKSIDLSGNTKLFDRIARKYNVDYAFHKTGPDKYLLFFKAGQADAITACFSDYTKLVMNRAKQRRPSIQNQLKQFDDRESTNPRKKERVREAVHGDR